MSRPIVLVPADVKLIDGHPFHATGEKYLTALVGVARVWPLVLPAFGEQYDVKELTRICSGILLTGSISNVEPSRYGGSGLDCPPYDPARDRTTLPLITAALDAGLPLLAICRGYQELNVALGGTLTERIHDLPGRLDHRAPTEGAAEVLYGPSHEVRLTPGGVFQKLAGGATTLAVNSLHWQGIDVKAARLAVEAVAPDGTIEAVRVVDAPGFALGVQWHPEWLALENPFSVALFSAFGDAVRQWGK
jgi:putative glutamine amidotransferase